MLIFKRLKDSLTALQEELERVQRNTRDTPSEEVYRVRERYRRSLADNALLDKQIREKESQVWDLKRKIMDYESQKKSLEDVNKKMQYRIRRLDDKLLEEEERINRFKIVLLTRDEESDNLWRRFCDLKSERDALKNALKEKENSILFAHGKKDLEIERLKKEYRMTLQNLQRSEEHNQSISRNLERVKEENEKIRNDINRIFEEELRRNRYSGMSQNDEVDDTEHSLWIKKYTDLQNKHQALLNKNNSLEKENQELKKKSNIDTARWRPLPDSHSNIQEMETLKRELVAAKELNKELEEKHRSLKQEKNDIALMHSNAIRRKEEDISVMKKRMECMEIEIKSLQSKQMDNDQAQVLSNTSEYHRLYEDKEKLRKENSSLKMELEQSHKKDSKVESEIRDLKDDIRKKQSEIQGLQEHIKQLRQELSETTKERDDALRRKDDVEKELKKVNRGLQDNLNQLQVDNRRSQEESARATSKMYGETEKQIDDMRSEVLRMQKMVKELEIENTKLRKSVNEEKKEKENALTRYYAIEAEFKSSNVKTEQKMREIERQQEWLTQNEREIKKLQQELSNVLKEKDNSLQRKNDSEQVIRHLEGSLNKLQAENKMLQDKVSSKDEEIRKIQYQMNSMNTETQRLQERVTHLATENSQLKVDIAEVSKEKDNALTRLSKVAGAKLTHGNAAITDLSDTNRPTKIAEKFSELYDNQWTDAFEELDNTYNNEEETIRVLLKILQEAYTFCVQTETNYETRIGQAVFTLADERTNETRQITGADVPVQKALTDLRLSLGNACCAIVEEMFLARLPSILKKVDVSVSPKTKLYARHCASLCWRMRIRDPPVFVRFEFRQGTEFNTDILRRYTKTGGYLDFIVWPALYLHENGPVLSKGVAQPRHSP
ncbi:trichohyalin-like [Saccostrea cucullata]|uniref:trichohyalin-like n=1 Tax=Saccostrea cuccullata TaxID=36930 RepID=UPI002ED28D0F